MSYPVLFAFDPAVDFQLAYAWSMELSRRLKARFKLFTSLTQRSEQTLTETYKALALAQGYYVKYFDRLQYKLPSIRSERNFLDGDFKQAFVNYTTQQTDALIVVQSEILPVESLKVLIHSHQKLIVLPSSISDTKLYHDRSDLFINVLNQAAIYNMPDSFFRKIASDTGIFNALSRFFKK